MAILVNGKKIRTMRESEQLSVSELATKVGISQPTMTNIEIGIKQPGVATLKRIADHFGISVDELIIPEESA